MNRCSKDIESGGHVRALRMLYSDKSLSVTPPLELTLPSTHEFTKTNKSVSFRILSKNIGNIDRSIDFLNVDSVRTISIIAYLGNRPPMFCCNMTSSGR